MDLGPFFTPDYLESERFWGTSFFLGVVQCKHKHTLHQETPEVSQMGRGLRGQLPPLDPPNPICATPGCLQGSEHEAIVICSSRVPLLTHKLSPACPQCHSKAGGWAEGPSLQEGLEALPLADQDRNRGGKCFERRSKCQHFKWGFIFSLLIAS